MRREFNNYYGLKRYLTVVAQNNNHNINFDIYDGFKTIYDYLHLHKDRRFRIVWDRRTPQETSLQKYFSNFL